LTFTYTIASGHTSSDLAYASASALSVNSGSIQDGAGNNATLTLPSPGASNSLSANKALVIDAAVPVITSDLGLSTISISITENISAVTTVIATDEDAAHTFSYSLSGTDFDDFTISSSGVLTFTSAPNHESPTDSNSDNQYIVIVTVTDNTSLTDTQTMEVTVGDVVEAADGASCSNANECESNVCDACGVCSGNNTACYADGESCANSNECSSDACDACGVCSGNNTACYADGESCANSNECSSDACDAC
ncbi:uncharacterized protein METZ01_LOCUS459748, partial [marine metagenome]